MAVKRCNSCGETFPAAPEHFYHQKSGLHGVAGSCITCTLAARRKNKVAPPEKKICTGCKEEKDSNSFYRHVGSPDGRETKCKACRKLIDAANPEAERQRAQKYRTKHAQVLAERQRIRYRASEALRLYKRDWVRRNSERVNENKRGWRKKNPHSVRASKHRRRAAQSEGRGVTTADIEAQYKSQKGLCWWCHTSLPESYHVDHRIALSAAGRHEPENICISCATCNLTKNARMPWEFNGRLL